MSGLESAAIGLLYKAASSRTSRFFESTEFERLCQRLADRFAQQAPLGAADYELWAKDDAFATALARYLEPPHQFDRAALIAAITPLVGSLDGETSSKQFSEMLADAIPEELRQAKDGDSLLRLEGDRIVTAVSGVVEILASRSSIDSTRGLPALLEGEEPNFELLRTGRLCPVEQVRWHEAGVRQPTEDMRLDEHGQVPFVERTVGGLLAARIAEQVKRPGPSMVVVAGPSAAGKTRLTFETLRRVCPSAWFLAPSDARAARELCNHRTLSGLPDDGETPVVVWLDDVEQFIEVGGEGLTPASFESFRAGTRPVVFVCTRGGRGQQVAGGDDRHLSLLALLLEPAGADVLLSRELDDEELNAATKLVPSAPSEELRAGLGSYAVARERLQARYEYAPDSGACAGCGDPADGRALVDALLIWRAVTGEDIVSDTVARRAWTALRQLRDRHQQPDDGAWQAAKDWATCAEVPGHPLVSWNTTDSGWGASDLIAFARPRPVWEAHQRLTDVLEDWAQDKPYGALRIASWTHRPEREGRIAELDETIERWYRRALDEQPYSSDVLGGLARLYEQQGQIERARDMFRQAIDADDTDACSWNNYALFCAVNESPSATRDVYEQALERAPSVSLLSNLGAFLDDQGELLRAHEVFHRALELSPNHVPLLVNAARHHERLRDYRSALRCYERISSVGGLSTDLASRWLILAGRVEDSDALAEAFAELVHSDTAGIDDVLRYVRYLIERGDLQEARAALLPISTTESLGGESLREIAALQEKLGDIEEASATFEQATRKTSRYLDAYVRFLERHGSTEEADAVLAGALADVPGDLGLLALRAETLAERGDAVQAETILESALASHPDDQGLLYAHVLALMHLGKLEEARAPAKLVASGYPMKADRIGNYGLILLELGEYKEAEEAFGMALVADPSHANNLANFARLLVRTNQDEAALSSVEAALECDPTLVNGLTVAAWLNCRAGELELAGSRFSRALELDAKVAAGVMLWLTSDVSDELRIAAGELFDPIAASHFDVGPQFAARAATLRAHRRIAQLEVLYRIAVAKGSS
jgi:Tfp pilus assembly protein PilF